MAKVLTKKKIAKIESVKELGNIPKHIAIIMDGNGRWARKRGLPRVAGHQQGIVTVREIVETCTTLGVQYLTLYTFSTENWKRPKFEVSTLMRLIVKSLRDETDELNANNIRLTTIGNIDILPQLVKDELNDAFERTKNNKRMVLNLALSYSGRWEITEAIKKIAHDVKNGLDADQITEETISSYLTTANMPDPDLLIRSGGELRISNFLLWQIAYSEIFVTEILWPDFNYNTLLDAVTDYQNRERRFGLVSEQLHKNLNQEKNEAKLSKQMV
ncbi:MAG: di-trans,poly-cis-decaprenylcistransferase [Ignavibacteriae bacterium HGW-Ignavibacteriae-2]|nr:MAG: di-trans,poly-cis-decaprenylcistransferase [Ignavibacteriae bacterium HGW-Ignavibacteriae-2]